MKKSNKLTMAALAVLAGVVGSTAGADAAGDTLTKNWADFCSRNQVDCVAIPSLETPAYTKQLKQTLIDVNSSVYWKNGYKTDQENFGKKEYWTYPKDNFGDCEDFALLKRKLLAQKGVPLSAMSLARVKEPGAKMAHIVLIVYTDKETFVLDSSFPELRSMKDTMKKYKMIAVQDRVNHAKWDYVYQ